MKVEIQIPTSLDEIPLVSYQKFQKTLGNSTDQEFIAQKTVEIFCGLNLKDVLKVKWSDISNLTIHLNNLFSEKPKFVPTFKIKDIEFGFIPNLEEISLGEYIDLETNITKVETFHKAMAVMYRPITERKKDKYKIMDYTGTDEFSELMQYAPISVVMGASVFFWSLGNDLVQTSLTYLEKEIQKDKKLKATLAKKLNLTNDGVGTIQFMQSLKATLQNLMQLPEWELKNV